MKAVKIILKHYDKLLLEVRDRVAQAQDSIARIATRQKIEMAWNVGKAIEKHLKKNKKSEKSSYGKHLFEQLESDVGIGQSTLYRMRKFYKTYPKIPQDDPKLNWSHYTLLVGVKRGEDRKYLEDLVVKKDLNFIELSKKIKNSKESESDKAGLPLIRDGKKKLTPRRGKMFCYKLVKPAGSDHLYIDCGFKIYREVTEKLPADTEIVESVKSARGYSFKKSATNPRQIYTYQAYLNRVVDGDTLHVMLDLGFGILHEENLRLCGINAPEAKTDGGAQATEGLKEILKTSPVFIVRTSSTDMYNRYLADIFLVDKGVKDLQKAADSGAYLNQLLLDKKLATLF